MHQRTSLSSFKSLFFYEKTFILVALCGHARMPVHVEVLPSYSCSRLSVPDLSAGGADGQLLSKCGPFINCVPKQPP